MGVARAHLFSLFFGSALVALSASCGSTPTTPPASGAKAAFDLAGGDFFSSPWPSDLRLDAEGRPDYAKFPNPMLLKIVGDFVGIAGQRKGFSVLPVAYFVFDAPIAPRDVEQVLPGDVSSPVMLVDVDEASPARGALIPVVTATPPTDAYVPDNTLAVAPRPGFVLSPKRRYAFVVKKALGDAAGKPLAVSPGFDAIVQPSKGGDVDRPHALYAPLFATLSKLGVPVTDVAVATVFTTGDAVQDTFDLTAAVAAKYKPTIDGLALVANNDATHDRFCWLKGTITYPQFQKGTPPYDKDGLFELGQDGLPIKQRDEVAPITITLPKATMPQGGFPLIAYFHGSGGYSTQVADGNGSGDPPDPLAQWPAYVNAEHGMAMAASAMPLNPERLKGASDQAYLNVGNPTAMRDTFRQGMIEAHLFLEALRTLQIPAAALQGCANIALPNGATSYAFDDKLLMAQGQSMGGMYTNMVGALEPRVREVVPTGAGGFWTYFIIKTQLIPGAAGLLSVAIGSKQTLSFVHPVLHVMESGWEPIDPIVYVPRLARRPLANHPVRPIYEPAGKDDSYFPTPVYDAMALAYGHKQAGVPVWPSTQAALALAKLDGVLPYPVAEDLTSEGGAKYTGAIVQWAGDGSFDPHAIYRKLDAVKYQYGCFHDTFVRTGTATIVEPKPLGTPCP